jgi:hypothetical protein
MRRHAFPVVCVLWAVLFAVVILVDVLPYLTATLEYTPPAALHTPPVTSAAAQRLADPGAVAPVATPLGH